MQKCIDNCLLPRYLVGGQWHSRSALKGDMRMPIFLQYPIGLSFTPAYRDMTLSDINPIQFKCTVWCSSHMHVFKTRVGGYVVKYRAIPYMCRPTNVQQWQLQMQK